MSSLKQRIALLAWAGTAVLWAAQTAAAPVAGSEIVNQASDSYTDSNGDDQLAYSNEVVLTVQPQYGATLARDRSKIGATGSDVLFYHTLTNSGNVHDTFEISVGHVTGDTGDCDVVAATIDEDDNGLADNGEPTVYDYSASTISTVLYSAESASIIVTCRVPSGLTGGETYRSLLTVQGQQGTGSAVTGSVTDLTSGGGYDTADDTNHDLVTVATYAILDISKSAYYDNQGTSTDVSDDTITYTLTVTNNGSAPANDVVIWDAVPPDTTFNSLGTKSGFGTTLDSNDYDPVQVTLGTDSVGGSLTEADLRGGSGADLNGDGDTGDASETQLGIDINYDGDTTDDDWPIVYAVDDVLAAGDSITMSYTVDLATTVGGTRIENEAHVGYDKDDPADGTDSRTDSNVTLNIVPSLYGVTLTDTGDGAGSDNTASPGVDDGADDDDSADDIQYVDTIPSDRDVSFKNIVTNTGNRSDSFNMSTTGSTFPSGTTFIFNAADGATPLVDTNSDGLIDTGTLDSGASTTIYVRAVMPPSSPTNAYHQVSAVATSAGNSAKSDDALEKVGSAAITVTKSSIYRNQGTLTDTTDDTIDYTVTVDNGSASAVRDLVVSDTMPTNTTFKTGTVTGTSSEWVLTPGLDDGGNGSDGYLPAYDSGTSTLTGEIDYLDAGTSVSFSYTVDIDNGLDGGTHIYNTASVQGDLDLNSATTEDPVPSNETDDVVASYYGVAISDTGACDYDGDSNCVDDNDGGDDDDTSNDLQFVDTTVDLAPGEVVWFRHNITNNGNATDTFNLEITSNDFPSGTVFTYHNSNGTLLLDNDGDAGSLKDSGDVARGDTISILIKATLPSTGSGWPGPYTATLTATSSGDSAMSDTTAERVRGDAISITKASTYLAGGAGGSNGDQIEYTVTVRNDSATGSVTGLTVSDTLPTSPSGITYDSTTGLSSTGTWSTAPSHDNTTPPGVITGSMDLAAGASVSFTYRISLPDGLAGGTTIQNQAEVDDSGTAIDLTYSNTTTDTVPYYYQPVISDIGGSATAGVNDGADDDATVNDIQYVDTIPGSGESYTAIFTNTVTNSGNAADTIDLTTSGSSYPAGTVFTFYQSDGSTLLTDSDSDGVVDTGSLAAGGSITIVVKADMSADSPTAGSFAVSAKATSSGDPGMNDTTTERVGNPYDVNITPSSASAVNCAGTVANYALTMNNDGAFADTFELLPSSPTQNWQVRLLDSGDTQVAIDADGDGVWDGGSYVTPSIAAGGTLLYTVEVTIPGAASAGTSNVISFEAISQNDTNITGTSTLTTTAQSCAVTLSNPAGKSNCPTTGVVYDLTVSNGGTITDSYEWSITSATQTWQVELLASDGTTVIATDTTGDGTWDSIDNTYDTNGDGNPDTGNISGGANALFKYRVTIPGGTGSGTVDDVVVELVSNRLATVNDNSTLSTTATAACPAVTTTPATASGSACPIGTVSYAFTVENTGSGNTTDSDTFDLSAISNSGWKVELLDAAGTTVLATDTNGDGTWDTLDTPSADSDGDGIPDSGPLNFPGGATTSADFNYRVTIPAGTLAGTTDDTTVSAASSIDTGVSDSNVYTTTVNNCSGVVTTPISDSAEACTVPTIEAATYDLAVTNAGNADDRLEFVVSSSLGWQVELLNEAGDTVLAVDTTGDGTWDTINSGDSDSDGNPDTNWMARGTTLNYKVRVTTGGTISEVDTTTVTLTSENDGTKSDSSSLTTTAKDCSSTDLQVTKTVDLSTPAEGDNVTFTLTVSNIHATVDTTGVELTDTLPDGLSYVSHAITSDPNVDAGDGYSSNSGVWHIGTLNTGESATMTLTAKVAVDTAGTTLTNLATITANDNDDEDTSNDGASAKVYPYKTNLRLTPNQEASIAPCASTDYIHTLVNTGVASSSDPTNVTENISLALTTLPSKLSATLQLPTGWSGTEPSGYIGIQDLTLGSSTVAVFDDSAGSWTTVTVLDDGSGNPMLPLAEGDSTTAKIRVFAPCSVAEQTREEVVLTATGQTSANSVSNTDVTKVTAADVTITKLGALDTDCNGIADSGFATAHVEAEPGQCVIWKLTVVNDGVTPVCDVTVYDTAPVFTLLQIDSASPAGQQSPEVVSEPSPGSASCDCSASADPDITCQVGNDFDITGDAVSESCCLNPGEQAEVHFRVLLE